MFAIYLPRVLALEFPEVAREQNTTDAFSG